jgi:hypothetical protein
LSLGLMLGVFAVIEENRKKARLAAQEGAGA